MYCNVPWNSLLIQPNGLVSICCAASNDWHMGHISEIDDLREVFEKNERILRLRKDNPDEIKLACNNCLQRSKTQSTRWTEFHRNHGDIKTDKAIRILEFTTSNICNQTCVSCSSFYSSKWQALDEELLDLGFDMSSIKNQNKGFASYGHKTYRLSDADIEKIIRLLPDLDILWVKGGEPFADDNNYKVLESLLKVNNACKIFFTSNMSNIPQKYIDLSADHKKQIKIGCSIDGIHDYYEYIRSSKFQKTIDNIIRWNEQTHIPISLGTSMSIYNLYGLEDMISYFKDNLYKHITSHRLERWITTPTILSVGHLLDEDELNIAIDEIKIEKIKHNKLDLKNFYNITHENMSLHQRKKLRSKFRTYTEFMNYKRGIDIYKIFPQLRKI